MAVPDSTPPVTPVPNNVKLLAQTLVQSGAIHRAVAGHFQHSSTEDTVYTSESHIFLAAKCEATERELRVLHKQPIHGTVLDLKRVRLSPDQHNSNQVQKVCWDLVIHSII